MPPKVKCMYDESQHSITVVGAENVGKTALVVRAVTGNFVDAYDPTIEDDFRRDTILSDSRVAAIHIVDTGGSEDFASMRKKWIEQSDAFLVVYSITSIKSFEYAKQLFRDISRTHDANTFSVVLVGTQADNAQHRQVPMAIGQKEAKLWNCPFFEVSAREGRSHESCMVKLVELQQQRTGQKIHNGLNTGRTADWKRAKRNLWKRISIPKALQFRF